MFYKTLLLLLTVFFNFCIPIQSNAQVKKKYSRFGEGIRYTNTDTTFTIKLNFRMQHLFEANYDEASDDISTQFQVRRSRIKMDGFALTPKLKYKVELGLSGRDISVSSEDGNGLGASRIILDAVLIWNFVKNWELWVGQTKLPGNRERVISSAKLQFVDRSLVNSRFNLDRDMGIQLSGKFKLGEKVYLNPSFAISQGEGRNITSSNFGGLNYTAHLDFLPFGKFANKGDYVSADLSRESSPKLSIGLTYDYNDGAVRQGGQLGSFVRNSDGEYAENSLTAFMIDLMFKYNGFSILSEYAVKSAAEEIVGLSRGFRTGNGFVIQAGYLLNNNLEFAMRYTTIRQDVNVSGISDQNEITLGLSKYIVGHSLKVQADISRISSPGESDGIIRFRTQVEMQF